VGSRYTLVEADQEVQAARQRHLIPEKEAVRRSQDQFGSDKRSRALLYRALVFQVALTVPTAEIGHFEGSAISPKWPSLLVFWAEAASIIKQTPAASNLNRHLATMMTFQ
jgi:hypothetical protein